MLRIERFFRSGLGEIEHELGVCLDIVGGGDVTLFVGWEFHGGRRALRSGASLGAK